jgi:hypothetical protein
VNTFLKGILQITTECKATPSLSLVYLQEKSQKFRKCSRGELCKHVYCPVANTEALSGIVSAKEQRYSMPYWALCNGKWGATDVLRRYSERPRFQGDPCFSVRPFPDKNLAYGVSIVAIRSCCARSVCTCGEKIIWQTKKEIQKWMYYFLQNNGLERIYEYMDLFLR